VDPVNQEQMNWLMKAFVDGGIPAMSAIGLVGVFSLALIIERFFTLKALSVDKNIFNENLFGMVLRGDIRQAISFCDSKPAPLTMVMKAGLVQVLNKGTDEDVQVAMDAAVLRETPRIEGWTSFLAVFGNLATLVGLFGTIIGLIIAFGGLASEDPAKKGEILASGISHALNCTAFGLLVAILSILSYGYFQVRIGRLINDMVESSMSLMNVVVNNRDKIKY
jgi:biopolymer transport protein ExbB